MLLMIMAMAMARAMAMNNHANKEYAQLMGRSWLMTITTTKTMAMPIKNMHSWWEGVDLCSGLHGADWPKHVQLHWKNIWQQGEEKVYSKKLFCLLANYFLLFDWPKHVQQSLIMLSLQKNCCLTAPNMSWTPTRTKHFMHGNVI